MFREFILSPLASQKDSTALLTLASLRVRAEGTKALNMAYAKLQLFPLRGNQQREEGLNAAELRLLPLLGNALGAEEQEDNIIKTVSSKYIRPIQSINSIETILEKSYFKAWLIGFIEAEGCFSLYKPSQLKTKVASFDVSQTNGSILINAIKKELSFRPNAHRDKTNNFKLKVTSVRDIENIIKYMHKAPIKLMGHKKLQFLLWLKELRTIPRYSIKFNIPDKY